jgi:hypothetical protein
VHFQHFNSWKKLTSKYLRHNFLDIVCSSWSVKEKLHEKLQISMFQNWNINKYVDFSVFQFQLHKAIAKRLSNRKVAHQIRTNHTGKTNNFKENHVWKRFQRQIKQEINLAIDCAESITMVTTLFEIMTVKKTIVGTSQSSLFPHTHHKLDYFSLPSLFRSWCRWWWLQYIVIQWRWLSKFSTFTHKLSTGHSTTDSQLACTRSWKQ